MGYKRLEWRSGLTYAQTCPLCRTRVIYKEDCLGFRPWFADGFVYCPTCKKPLRHNEAFAIGPDGQPLYAIHQAAPQSTPTAGGTRAQFCTNCGRHFSADDNFCSGCGAKRG